MPTWNIGISISGPSTPYSQSVALTGGGTSTVEGETVATDSTDTLINWALDVSTCKALYILSTASVTIETNATDATGGNTLNLTANVPIVWYTGCGYSCPLTADVTKFYVTNASGATAAIYAYALHDVTP